MIHTEVSILRCLKHSNIVQLIEDFETTDELFLVMELVTVSDMSVTVFLPCHGASDGK